jgi:hypothetical protein
MDYIFTKMKEEEFKLDSFIGGWYIPEEVCTNLIEFFNNKKNRQFKGVTAKDVVDESWKRSTDVSLNSYDSILDDYYIYLNKCLKLYLKKYPEANSLLSRYDHFREGINIQRYLPGEGFYKWHCERTSRNDCTRTLVFMTYLNNVEDGGTEFKYQGIKVPAKTGLTLIWPTDFTHTHRGIVAKETKYIITGWFNFI